MWLRSSLLVQTLLLGLQSEDDTSSGSREGANLIRDTNDMSNSIGDSSEEWLGVQQVRLSPIPDPNDYPTMARFIMHNVNWTALAYISGQRATAGRALADMVSVSDGPVEAGTGTPYFYVSRLQAAVTDLLDNDASCSLTVGLQQTALCKERDWDDEDPRCAHLVLTGKFKVVDVNSAEFLPAQNALFTRHPSFRTLPAGHHFFVAKFDIQSITLQDFFGGPVNVPVEDYFRVKNQAFDLVRGRIPHPRRKSNNWQTIDNNYIVVQE